MYFSKIRSDVVENTEVEKALEKVTYKCNSTPKAIDSNYCVIAHVSPFSPSNLPNPLGLIQTSFHSYSNPFCLWVFVLVAVRRPSHKERALGYDIKGIVNKPSSEIHPPPNPSLYRVSTRGSRMFSFSLSWRCFYPSSIPPSRLHHPSLVQIWVT